MVERFDVFLVNLDDEICGDAKNTRPCPVTFLNSERSVVLDQLRAVDNARLVKKVGVLESAARKPILDCLTEMFAE